MTETKNNLLEQINAAVAAMNDSERSLTTAQVEHVSRSKRVGLLLLEAKKLHPEEAFEAFLKRVQGLKRSRVFDLMRLAGGRTTDEELKKATSACVKKHRASKKLPRPAPSLKKPEPKPEPESVTSPNVTDSAEAGAGKAKTEKREADKTLTPSELAFAEFNFACRRYLPRMNEADQRKARLLVSELTGKPARAEAA
jgi:hypothetical protein